jgi:hypothetical protein
MVSPTITRRANIIVMASQRKSVGIKKYRVNINYDMIHYIVLAILANAKACTVVDWQTATRQEEAWPRSTVLEPANSDMLAARLQLVARVVRNAALTQAAGSTPCSVNH